MTTTLDPQSTTYEDAARRLQVLEDRHEIRRLVNDYRRHLDARDLAAYSALFARDGVWDGTLGRAEGPAAIEAMLERELEPNPPAPGATSWHLITDPEIEVDGDRARGAVTWALVTRSSADEPELTMLGHYRDDYVREDGRWRFALRRSWVDVPADDAPLDRSPVIGLPAVPAEAVPTPTPDGSAAAQLAALLADLEDREAIRSLVKQYRNHLDARDLAAYSQLFADDGEWRGASGYGRGPDGIRAMLEQRLAPNPAAPGETSFHLITDPVIELNGDRASGTLTWALLVRDAQDRPRIELLGHYEDEYVRTGGRWRFLDRRAVTDIPNRPLAES